MDSQTRYDTADVRPKDRFAFWREAVCDSYVQLGCEADDPHRFRGSIDIARHSALSISRVAGVNHMVHRRKRDIRAASEEFFLLSLQQERTSRVTQFGSTAALEPGDMALYVTSAPYRLDLDDDFSQLVVQLPKQSLLERLPNASMLAGKRIDGRSGIGKLVSDNIVAFARHASTGDPALQSLVQTTLIDLIATGLAASICETAELSSPEQHVLLRAKSFIRANLGDPDLDRTRVAAEIGLSVRRLNAIFAKEDSSLADHIRTQRLKSVSEDLRDPRCAALTISEVAIKNGFSNLQHFSTLFKARYGATPKGWRAAAGAASV